MAQRTNTDTGSPAHSGNTEDTGIPSVINDENAKNDERLTNDYTRDEEDVADGVRERHPNRNVDKGNSTGIGGYRG